MNDIEEICTELKAAFGDRKLLIVSRDILGVGGEMEKDFNNNIINIAFEEAHFP